MKNSRTNVSSNLSTGQSNKGSHLFNYLSARKYITLELYTQSITSCKPREVSISFSISSTLQRYVMAKKWTWVSGISVICVNYQFLLWFLPSSNQPKSHAKTCNACWEKEWELISSKHCGSLFLPEAFQVDYVVAADMVSWYK